MYRYYSERVIDYFQDASHHDTQLTIIISKSLGVGNPTTYPPPTETTPLFNSRFISKKIEYSDAHAAAKKLKCMCLQISRIQKEYLFTKTYKYIIKRDFCRHSLLAYRLASHIGLFS